MAFIWLSSLFLITGTAATLPTPMEQAGHIMAPRGCMFWDTAKAGATCNTISEGWGISVEEFQRFNPGVTDCSSLVAGTSYCVEWSGDISGQGSVSSVTSSAVTTAKTPASSKPPATTKSTTKTSPSPSPTQSGIVTTCNKWHKVESGDYCQKIADANHITLEEFYQWNPAVGSDCSLLFKDYYVCVGAAPSGSPTKPTPTKSTTSSTAPPIKTQPGVVQNCTKFHRVISGDSCWGIENSNHLDDSDFRSWNPMLDDSCGNLWAGYDICIGID